MKSQVTESVADPAMGGPGAPLPHWPKLTAGHGSVTQTRGKFSPKSLTFGHFFIKMYKSFQTHV